MRYLFTYKYGKKALGTSTINRGIAIKVGDTTVYPLLVSPTAYNASCIRTKVNNEIKSIAYVPSLIIPGVLCAKSGSSYIDPAGIYLSDTFYKEVFYDTYHGQYIAFSSYSNRASYASSVDGRNWHEGWNGVLYQTKDFVVNTKIGVLECGIIVQPRKDSGYTVYNDYYLEVRKLYWNGSNNIRETLFTLQITDMWGIDDFKMVKQYTASNSSESVIIDLECEYTINNITYFVQNVWNINLNTNTVTELFWINTDNQTTYETKKIGSLNYNNILHLFLYAKEGAWYYSSSGINFIVDWDNTYKISRGNLNGAEVFNDGISYDGKTIAKTYTHRPNAYDPIEEKYIRVATSWHATGEGNKRNYYFDVYESKDLNNWTFVLRREHTNIIWPQDLDTVNTDGFACVKGF